MLGLQLVQAPPSGWDFVSHETVGLRETPQETDVYMILHDFTIREMGWSCKWGGKNENKRVNLLLPFSIYRFFSSLPLYRLSAFHHNEADLKRLMHMHLPLGSIKNYFGSGLLNTIKDMVSLFGGNLHGGVISGRWYLKLVFGIILLSFLLSFCYRFVSHRFFQSVVRGT